METRGSAPGTLCHRVVAVARSLVRFVEVVTLASMTARVVGKPTG